MWFPEDLEDSPLISKHQNHEDNCEKFCGLFRKAELYILSPQEAQRASMKPPGSYKKTQGRNPEIISLVFFPNNETKRTF